MKAYLTKTRPAYVDMEFKVRSVFHSTKLESIIAGIRRLRGEVGTQERRPITKDLLLQILP